MPIQLLHIWGGGGGGRGQEVEYIYVMNINFNTAYLSFLIARIIILQLDPVFIPTFISVILKKKSKHHNFHNMNYHYTHTHTHTHTKLNEK